MYSRNYFAIAYLYIERKNSFLIWKSKHDYLFRWKATVNIHIYMFIRRFVDFCHWVEIILTEQKKSKTEFSKENYFICRIIHKKMLKAEKNRIKIENFFPCNMLQQCLIWANLLRCIIVIVRMNMKWLIAETFETN